MHAIIQTVFLLYALAQPTSANNVVITVGGRTTFNDASSVFSPSTVIAQEGDQVFFNFTHGNHTVTQSTFASPCVPIHDTDITVNGFNSGYRPAGNEQAVTNLVVPITASKTTIWFYDDATCGQGGVGAINVNKTSPETFDGFQRNAIRLNGTSSKQAQSSSATNTAIPTHLAPSSTAQPNSGKAGRSLACTIGPMIMAAFIPSFAFVPYL